MDDPYSPVPNNSAPPPRPLLLLFGFFVGPLPPLSYLDPPLINFSDFALQIFQRFADI